MTSSPDIAAPDDAPTDVLVILTDQWRWDAVGRLGSPARTPVFDELAASGVHFDHAVVQSPVCMPSRVSMLTGRYPSDLGITRMGVPVPEDTETVARTVSRRGWRTANIGKLHFLPHANRDHTTPHPSYGFDVLALSDEPGVYEDDYRAWVRRHHPEALPELDSDLPPAARTWQETLGLSSTTEGPGAGSRADYDGHRVFAGPEEATHSAWVATRTIDHLRGLAPGQPAFTVASFFSPHPPFHVPRRFLDLYDPAALPLPDLTDEEWERAVGKGLTPERVREVRHGYYAAVSEVDHHVGRILAALEELGRAERTLVVVVSDHGEWLGDGARVSKGHPADDPVSRVPLMFRWPRGVLRPGRTVSSVVEAVDIAPTVLEALGIPVPTGMQGTSLLPVLRDVPDADLPEAGLTEHAGWRTLRTACHRYLVHEDGRESLWDMEKDPAGRHDLAHDPGHADVLAAHRLILLRRILQTERHLPRVWPY